MKLTPVPPTDINYVLLDAIDRAIRKYVVTWFPVGALRSVYGIYKSVRVARNACRSSVIRNAMSKPLCFIIEAGAFFSLDQLNNPPSEHVH